MSGLSERIGEFGKGTGDVLDRQFQEPWTVALRPDTDSYVAAGPRGHCKADPDTLQGIGPGRLLILEDTLAASVSAVIELPLMTGTPAEWPKSGPHGKMEPSSRPLVNS